jgi:hypothetical protein
LFVDLDDKDMSTAEFTRYLENTINKLIDKKLNKSKIPAMWTGVVTAYNGTTKQATLYTVEDEVINTDDYPNFSGQTLVANDLVYLISDNGSLTNAFVAFKRNVQQV